MFRSQEIQQLIEDSPIMVLTVRRDGTLLGHTCGRVLSQLIPDGQVGGKLIDELWPESMAKVLTQLCRKAITSRASVDGRFQFDSVEYEARATPLAPDRANCIIRAAIGGHSGDLAGGSSRATASVANRRRFIEQIHEAIAAAILKETPAALIVLTLNGLSEIAEIDGALADAVVQKVLSRFSGVVFPDQWRATSIGPINEAQLGLVAETSNRAVIDEYVAALQHSVQEPVQINQDTWHLACHAGVSLLGRDANSAKQLLDQARMAANEARRMHAPRAQFFSDTMRLKSVTRIDMARELRSAISSHEVGMRYQGRHELSSGRLQALVGYVTWRHPMRGDMTPTEFLNVAEVSGASVDLSREMLRTFGHDIECAEKELDSGVCFSYGPLRHHLMHEHFIRDVQEFLGKYTLAARRFEVRVTERCFVALPARVFSELEELGVRTIVDEVGRSLGSLARLATLPLWGMQLDRRLVEDALTNSTALRLCRAGIGASKALGLSPIAAGIDHEATRALLLECGCRYGSGDFFASPGVSETLAPSERETSDATVRRAFP
jgi:predicted signal transduction protein with EAL and GGDEF domain